MRDLYRTEIEVFRNPLWVIFYVIGTLLVGLHMRHGVSSAFQSLGLDHPRYYAAPRDRRHSSRGTRGRRTGDYPRLGVLHPLLGPRITQRVTAT